MSENKFEKSYFWKNSEFQKIDPAVAAVALQEIKEKHGMIKTHLVVEEAADPSHPLHGALPWDDDEAAQIGREAVAARLIRSLKVRIVREEKPPLVVRAFVSTSNEAASGGRSYAEVTEALSGADGRAYVIKQAWLQLKAWKSKYGTLSELSEVLPLVDEVLEALA